MKLKDPQKQLDEIIHLISNHDLVFDGENNTQLRKLPAPVGRIGRNFLLFFHMKFLNVLFFSKLFN